MSHRSAPKLTPEQRQEITRRVLAGETSASLAKEFGVTPQCVSLIKNKALHPERFLKKAEAKMTRKLTRAEHAKFIKILSTSTPEEQRLIPAREKWALDHGRQLIKRLFKKNPSKRLLMECMEPYMPKRSEFKFGKPQPPKKHHVNQLDPELAKDKDYVKYYLSPICEQIAWREYELALADWNERFAHEEEDDGAPAEIPAPAPSQQQPAAAAPVELTPRLRVGKHAKSKGSPFTPAKRKKKRR